MNDVIDPSRTADELRESILSVRSRIAQVLVGQKAIVDQVLVALLSGGHVLLEGSPGVGKTLLVKAIGRVFSLDTGRIQFTPDLMPSDVLGGQIIDSQENAVKLTFQPGPIFTELLLADEINRANPRTQSALLEAMAESQVTVAGTTRALGPPFFVLATQNPIDMEGTYPLPEAQADRFMMKLTVPQPDAGDLTRILDVEPRSALKGIRSVVSRSQLLTYQKHVGCLPASEEAKSTIVDLLLRTRPEKAPSAFATYIRLGASPRGAQALLAAARARAAMAGRLNVMAEDVRALARPVLRHRLLLGYAARADGIDADGILAAILQDG